MKFIPDVCRDASLTATEDGETEPSSLVLTHLFQTVCRRTALTDLSSVCQGERGDHGPPGKGERGELGPIGPKVSYIKVQYVRSGHLLSLNT